MKYKDRHTINSWNKSVDRLELKSEWGVHNERNRNTIRKSQRQKQKIFNKIICHVDRDWWECISENDKDRIYSEYFYFHRFEDFITCIKNKYKVDMSLYRDKKINKILSNV